MSSYFLLCLSEFLWLWTYWSETWHKVIISFIPKFTFSFAKSKITDNTFTDLHIMRKIRQYRPPMRVSRRYTFWDLTFKTYERVVNKEKRRIIARCMNDQSVSDISQYLSVWDESPSTPLTIMESFKLKADESIRDERRFNCMMVTAKK